MTVAQLLTWCRQITDGDFDGVTISGGEPFEQPQALGALLDGLIHWRTSGATDFDILCYSGYPLATLHRKHARLLRKLDALIPEPYIDSKPLTHVWRGSSNQPLVLISERGKQRFGAFVNAEAGSAEKRIQATVDGNRIWYVGIPARGDMAAVEQSCKERGVIFDQVSWRQ
jgi:anaerobic ribonucleoside-triphosphate reductase activating protein